MNDQLPRPDRKLLYMASNGPTGDVEQVVRTRSRKLRTTLGLSGRAVQAHPNCYTISRHGTISLDVLVPLGALQVDLDALLDVSSDDDAADQRRR